MNRKKLAIIMAAMLCSRGLQAAEPGNDYVGQEVVVTGTRSEQRLEKIPAYIEVITSADIRKSGAQTVPEALQSLSGVAVSDNNRQRVDMEGFGDTADRNVAVLLDGRRLNPIDMAGPDWSTIPVADIERIEVLYGPGSVLYGDNAKGGVINIITKKPVGRSSANFDLYGGTSGRKGANGSLTIADGETAMSVGGSFFDTNGYRIHSEENRSSGYGNLRLKPLERLSVTADFKLSDSEYNLPGSLSLQQIRENRRQVQPGHEADRAFDDASKFGVVLQYDMERSGIFSLDASYGEEKRIADMASLNYYMVTNMFTRTLSPKYLLDSEFGGFANRLTLGADFQQVDYDATKAGSTRVVNTWMNHERKSLAGFVQNELNLTGALVLSAGYRYEHVDLDLGYRDAYGTSLTKSGTHQWAGDVGLSYAFLPGSKLYGKVSRAYRYPVIDEMVSWFGGSITELKPDRSTGYELGLRVAGNDRLILNARGYLRNVEDEILYDPDANLWGANINYPNSRHLGTNFDARYRLKDSLTLFGGVAYTRASFTSGDYDGKAIPLVPNWKTNIGIEYDFGSGLHSRVQYNYVGRQYLAGDMANALDRLDDYRTVDLHLDYRMKQVDLYLTATNIFDEKYASFAANNWNGPGLYPMPEAVYTVGMRMKF
ncbi:MAG: TonB-dependent receptor [Chlorobiaceae bacterium]|nr:TonB-dependent receptor [Chlorobiaceae bacterium]